MTTRLLPQLALSGLVLAMFALGVLAGVGYQGRAEAQMVPLEPLTECLYTDCQVLERWRIISPMTRRLYVAQAQAEGRRLFEVVCSEIEHPPGCDLGWDQ